MRRRSWPVPHKLRRGTLEAVEAAARGARGGKYLVLHEIESLDSRDRYFPGPGEQSEEFTRFLEQHPETAAAMEKWERYSTIHSENDMTTDYVAVAE